jgi:hypothetical protein
MSCALGCARPARRWFQPAAPICPVAIRHTRILSPAPTRGNSFFKREIAARSARRYAPDVTGRPTISERAARKRRRLFARLPALVWLLPLVGFAGDVGVAGAEREITRAELRDRIYGGWVGMLIGGLEGLPHEFKYTNAPRDTLPDFEFLPAGARSDDDNDFEWTHLWFMDREGVIKLPYPRIVEIWKANMNQGLWVANRQARRLMDQGVLPPDTGSTRLNPFAGYNLSGQFCVESYGLIAPGMPQTAADIGLHYARIAVSEEPLQAAQFWTSLISLLPFHNGTMEEALTLALQAVDPRSAMAGVVNDARRLFNRHPHDWKAARQALHEQWLVQRGWNGNSTPMNGGYVVLALLYGTNDFYRTLQYAMALGQDADCNAATAGAVLGNKLGFQHIAALPQFKMPDRYVNRTRPELPAESKVSDQVETLLRVSERVILAHGGAHMDRNGQPAFRIRLQPPRVLARLGDEAGAASPLNWRPARGGKDLRLQDFCCFEYRGKTVIASMMKDFCQEGITLAESSDLVHWKHLGTALTNRTAEDRSMVWAPHVVESGGVYYLFYTGVTTPQPGQWCQRILVASSTMPDDPTSWRRSTNAQFVVGGQAQHWFRPDHPGSLWSDGAWADCRDPMVLEKNGTWHLYYSGHDEGAGVCGVATARSILGPWVDRGAVLKVADGTIPESCFVLEDPAGGYVMVFNHAGPGGGIRIARSPSLVPVNGRPPFTNVETLPDSTQPGLKGWAHEFLRRPDGSLLAAYLTGYFITFEPARFVREARGWTIGANRGGR